MRWPLFLLPAMAISCAVSCSRFPPDPLQLDRGMLTVENQSRQDWQRVEIWINEYYRVTAPSLAAGGRLQVPADAFVSGYGRRFDPKHAFVTNLRLTAQSADGSPVALKKQWQKSGLALLGKEN